MAASCVPPLLGTISGTVIDDKCERSWALGAFAPHKKKRGPDGLDAEDAKRESVRETPDCDDPHVGQCRNFERRSDLSAIVSEICCGVGSPRCVFRGPACTHHPSAEIRFVI